MDTVNIILVILETANQGLDDGDNNEKTSTTTSNEAMYTTLFNRPQLKEYWNALIQRGLLKFDTMSQMYKTTAEGRSFLKAYKEMDYDVINARSSSSRQRKRTTKINMLSQETS